MRELLGQCRDLSFSIYCTPVCKVRPLVDKLRLSVIQRAESAGRSDVVKTLRHDLPDSDALRFYADQLGGTIMVSHDYCDSDFYPPMLFGTGPLIMHVFVHHVYVAYHGDLPCQRAFVMQ